METDGTDTSGASRATGLLSAIVCPLVPREVPQALANMRQWNDRLTPGRTAGPPPRMIFSFNCGPDPELERTLRDAWRDAPIAAASFSGLDVLFLDLPEEKDQYIRKPVGPPPLYGYKSGPNWMFYETMKALRDEARFVFLMEVDCEPIVDGWLRPLERTCERNDDAWVVGAHYSGASPLLWRVARHINGNALYNVGDRDFATFLDRILWPWLHQYIAEVDPDLAYDCAWETYLNREEMDYAGHHDWIVSRGVLHKFRLTDTIVNIGGHAEQSGQYMWTREALLSRFPSATIAHGPVGSGDTHHRGPRLRLGRPSLTDATATGDAALTLDEKSALATRSIWPAEGAFAPGTTVTVLLTMLGAPGQIIAIDLREPMGGMMERKKAFIGEDGRRRVKGEFVLKRPMNYIVLAFMVLQLADPSAIAIEEILVTITEGDEVSRIRDFMRA